MRALALSVEGSIAGVSRAFTTLYREALEAGAPVGAPPLTVYPDSPESFNPAKVRFSVCLPLKGELPELPQALSVMELPAVTAAVIVHEGPYEKIGPAYESLLAWCAREGWKVMSPVREVYVVGPDPSGRRLSAEYRTEVQFPVERG